MIAEFPRAILHVDADAFFTSVEQALNPALRGKPVVTGQERGIIACASYEAKALGIKRGVPLFEARRRCPALVILPSDYETYSLYSRRMFEIMRRFSPDVEEYSIDEAFVDLTGMRRVFRCSYDRIARRLQEDIARELGLTVSAGLSLSKSLAKRCSTFRKPRGFTAVPGKYVHLLLARTPLAGVWGFGRHTVALLEKYGLRTALDYAHRPAAWARNLLGKPGIETWRELRGDAVWKVDPEPRPACASMIKSKTFTPPSSDPDLVYAKLVRNVESVFAKLRRHRMRTDALGVVLRRQDFTHDGVEARLTRATAQTVEILPLVRRMFDEAFQAGCAYRSTLIALGNLASDRTEQYDLFEDRVAIASCRRLTRATDDINARYGKYTLSSAASLFLPPNPSSPRETPPQRWNLRFPGETARRRLAVPRGEMQV